MTPNELAAQLREKATRAATQGQWRYFKTPDMSVVAAPNVDGAEHVAEVIKPADADADHIPMANPANIATILDAYEKMREALKKIGCRFMNDTLCSTKPLDRMCYVCGALASLDEGASPNPRIALVIAALKARAATPSPTKQ